jgi:hypothetical protein
VYPTKLFFTIKGEIKTFHDKHKLNESMTTTPAEEKIFIGILQRRGRLTQP